MGETDEQIEQIQQIREIRNIMERSSRFISLSGLAGVSAGFFALAGAWAFYIYIHRANYSYTELVRDIKIMDPGFVTFCILDAAAVAFFSLCFAVFFTTRKAKRLGLTIWDSAARRLIINLAIPLAAGGVFCLILLFKWHWFGLVAPATLLFYGLALLNASKYTLDEIRYLGISEIILGLAGCFFLGYGVTLWAIGFGVLHIIYGLVMYMKYDSKPQQKKFW